MPSPSGVPRCRLKKREGGLSYAEMGLALPAQMGRRA
jgi:hypothetical protein